MYEIWLAASYHVIQTCPEPQATRSRFDILKTFVSFDILYKGDSPKLELNDSKEKPNMMTWRNKMTTLLENHTFPLCFVLLFYAIEICQHSTRDRLPAEAEMIPVIFTEVRRPVFNDPT